MVCIFLKWEIVCSFTPCLVCRVSSSEDAGLCYQTSNCSDAWLALCGACHGGEAVLGVPPPSNNVMGLQKKDLLESHMLAVICHEHCRIESHSDAAIKFFVCASLHTAAFPSVLEESSDINFHSFQQKQIVLY